MEWEELEMDDDKVRYVLIPSIIIEADDKMLNISIEWLKWGFGITIMKREE